MALHTDSLQRDTRPDKPADIAEPGAPQRLAAARGRWALRAGEEELEAALPAARKCLDPCPPNCFPRVMEAAEVVAQVAGGTAARAAGARPADAR